MSKKSTSREECVVRKTADQIRRSTPEELQRLVDLPPSGINFSDIPPVSSERIAAMKPAGQRFRKRAG